MKKICAPLLLVFALVVSCSKHDEKITGISQLNDKRICVLTGSAGDVAAKKAFPNAEFLYVITASDAALTVKTGKADAFVHNKNILMHIVDKDSTLALLKQPVSQVGIAAAFKKENSVLLADFNNALRKLKEDGTLEVMRQKWIATKYKVVPELPNIQLDGKKGVLVIGTCAKAEPQTFQYNNIITGYDIELALRIAEMLGKKIEIKDLNFESLVPALQSGKIDVAISNFNVTEERKKFVNFSDDYITNDISVLVRK